MTTLLTTGRHAAIVTVHYPEVRCTTSNTISTDCGVAVTAMTKIHKFDRKPSAKLLDTAGPTIGERHREKAKPARTPRPARDQPAGRAQTESPRGSTIPPHPKERIDD